jgi:enterochelin esterase family protein
MRRVEGGWEMRLSDLPVDRLEYLIDVDGVLQPDPSNPRRVAGPFGDHSWVPLPAYREPAWLGQKTIESERASLTLSRTGAGRIDAEIWSPADAASEPLPMLISHDGPEMDAFGALTSYAGAMIVAGTLPPFRVVLVSPGPRRNQRYAANPRYARAVATRLVPALVDAVPTSQHPVLMGQSLGALAALHAVWTNPHLFSGVFLQSGSFFTVDLDPQESGFDYWREVTGFVAGLHAVTAPGPDTPPMTFTCGSAEENHANNRAIRDQLAAIGVHADWGEVRDTHTWTCWRDTLDPHLTALLCQVWA